MGIENGKAILKDSLAICYNTKYILNVKFSNHLFGVCLNGVKNLRPHKNMHMDVYSKFIHNYQNFE